MGVAGELEPEVGKPTRRHRDGQPWHRVTPPRRWHRCWTQTLELGDDLVWMHRCPCGAQRASNTHMWVSKNSRRQGSTR